MDKPLTVNAPCKINVHLKVKRRRPDGYHNLESIFLALAFGDVLRFERTGHKGACDIRMDWKFQQNAGETGLIPAEKNIVYQAAALFRSRTGFNGGIRVHIEKRIPLGAGLGGGSSDAAAALKALNVLAGTALAPQVLQEMAEILGSDVPFFLSGGAAWVSGRGEQIVPIAVPKGLSAVLVYPGFPSSTREAFQLLDEVRLTEKYSSDTESAEALIQGLSEPPGKWYYKNDFLPVFLAAGDPEAARGYRSILKDLTEAGADFTGLSGSGSACFGIFADEAAAKTAAQAAAEKKNWVQVTFPLAHFTKEGLE